MNFLAHFHLAWPCADLISGGLEGDYYKGPLGADLPPGLARGIHLHRSIDAYTDRHPLVAQLRTLFPQALRRYAGILIDLSFDHYLSHHWSRYSDLPLEEFNRGVHDSLASREHQLSANARRMLGRLRDHNILNLYHDWRTVTGSAARIGERFRRGNPLLAVERELAHLRPELERVFLEFYPDLQLASGRWQVELNQSSVPLSNIALSASSP